MVLTAEATAEQPANAVRETPSIPSPGLQVWERGGDGVLAVAPSAAPAGELQTDTLSARVGCPYAPALAQAAVHRGLPVGLVLAVVDAETRCRHVGMVSPKGAIGLMQLMPATAARFGASNPWDVAQNIAAGTAYLAWLRDRFGGDQTRMVAAYNAGEGAVDRHNGVPPFAETRAYVRRVLARMPQFADDAGELARMPAPIVAVVAAAADSQPGKLGESKAVAPTPPAHNRSNVED